METSDYVEIALVIIILAVCVTLGIGTTAATYKKVLNEDMLISENKNTKSVDITADTVVNEGMTYEDVIMMVESQDYQMNEPNEFTVVDGNVAIGTVVLEDRYREQLVYYSARVGGLLAELGDIKTSRYRVYETVDGDLINKEGKTFAIEKIN